MVAPILAARQRVHMPLRCHLAESKRLLSRPLKDEMFIISIITKDRQAGEIGSSPVVGIP
eukprot:8083100-Pyramimonas_sp.AAC.3